jgi:hypothetical protein
MLRLPIILITIYKDKLYYKVKQYKDNSTNIIVIDICLLIFKHWCPSGLRGATQVRMASASWVRTPPNV